jgi:aminoglycoside/choline kinase family phosphotransferase
MDAPPNKEALGPFVQVAKILQNAGLNVPTVMAENYAEGFLLLSDLGTKTYLDSIDKKNAKQLYGDASDALIKMQLASRPHVLPPYDTATLQREMDLFEEWYLKCHHQTPLDQKEQTDLGTIFTLIKENNVAQTQVYVHRDYHSRNLMYTDQNNPGVLDFQDALYGPITYDAVSLLRDAYIEWSEEEVIDFLIDYWERARKVGLSVPSDFADFYRDFEWMGLQRHLKILGIFARLYHRDGKENYLKDIPLVLKYVRAVASRYIVLKPLLRILDRTEVSKV